jgi:hypothetical protein
LFMFFPFTFPFTLSSSFHHVGVHVNQSTYISLPQSKFPSLMLFRCTSLQDDTMLHASHIPVIYVRK